MTRVLLTFTGFHDPYIKGLVGQEEQLGPILTLIAEQTFDIVVLFSTPNTEKVSADTKTAILSLVPKMRVDIFDIPLDDPTDYILILQGLRRHIRDVQEEIADGRYFISVASGTPQMHACWVLLTAAGEIPARILHVRPPRFVTKDRPLITEIDLTTKDFPVVRSKFGSIDVPEIQPMDLATVIHQLGIVGDHPKMKSVLETASMLATSNVPVLIHGETGTGKELFARFIHRMSGRPADHFVALNCAAIPENLVESILFGHKKGSFTSAVNDSIGKFDLANNGTLFLDELAELPAPIQAKLLRVLQDGLVEPIGGKKPHKVDVRVITATNKDLRKAIKNGKFREDLYYRLAVGEIQLPPLRERRSDIPIIALHILDRVNATIRRPRQLTPEALTRLQSYNWPGNVRDLENVIERSVRLSRQEILDSDDLLITEPVSYADPLNALPDPSDGFSLENFLGSARKQLILRALEATNGNQSEAARLLGITPQAVHKFLQKTKDLNPS